MRSVYGTVVVDRGLLRVKVTAEKCEGRLRVECKGAPEQGHAEREIAVRVAAALGQSEGVRITLEPGGLIQPGSRLIWQVDLAAAVAARAELNEGPDYPERLYVGALTFDGRVHAVRGAGLALLAHRGVAFVPRESLAEAAAFAMEQDVVLGVDRLHEAIDGSEAADCELEEDPLRVFPTPPSVSAALKEKVRFAPRVRRALEAVAAGRHSLMLAGPPGCGKTLAARTVSELIELNATSARGVLLGQSISGMLPLRRGEPLKVPFRAPHHTVSEAGLVGSRSHLGELDLAAGGVLFLDESQEFRRSGYASVVEKAKTRSVRLVASASNYARGYERVARSTEMVVELERGYLGEPGEPEDMVARVARARQILGERQREGQPLLLADTLAALDGLSVTGAVHAEEAASYGWDPFLKEKV